MKTTWAADRLSDVTRFHTTDCSRKYCRQLILFTPSQITSFECFLAIRMGHSQLGKVVSLLGLLIYFFSFSFRFL